VRTLLRILLAGGLAAFVLCAVALGRGASPADAPPEAAAPRSGCRGKPSPPVGDVEVRVVERPAPGRAVVEVQWRRGPRGEAPAVDLGLPRGAYLVRGRAVQRLARDTDAGVLRYEIAYDDAEPLDVVARLRATAGGGGRTFAREACVRLTE
jgi:hypothetical protein